MRHDVVVKLNGQWMTVFNVRAVNAAATDDAVQQWVPGAEVISAQTVPHTRSGETVFARYMNGQPVEGIGN